MVTRRVSISQPRVDMTLTALDEAIRIADVMREHLPPQSTVQGRFYRRKDGSTHFSIANLTPTPKKQISELLDGKREVLHTADIPPSMRVDEGVVRRLRAALKPYVELTPYINGRRGYEGKTANGVKVKINTHICNGEGMKVRARSNVGYFLTCTAD